MKAKIKALIWEIVFYTYCVVIISAGIWFTILMFKDMKKPTTWQGTVDVTVKSERGRLDN